MSEETIRRYLGLATNSLAGSGPFGHRTKPYTFDRTAPPPVLERFARHDIDRISA